MSLIVSIRLEEELIKEAKKNAHLLHLSQTAYIREAITRMNQEIEHQERKQRLKNASLKVRKSSMEINHEFDDIEHDPED